MQFTSHPLTVFSAVTSFLLRLVIVRLSICNCNLVFANRLKLLQGKNLIIYADKDLFSSSFPSKTLYASCVFRPCSPQIMLNFLSLSLSTRYPWPRFPSAHVGGIRVLVDDTSSRPPFRILIEISAHHSLK